MKSWYEKYYGLRATYERIGELDIRIPDVPESEFIANYHRPQQQQKWRRIIEPKEFAGMDVEQQKKHSFVKREFHRKKHGFWFMNNGVPTYITGFHYMYLQWWKLNNGIYPDYRSSDRKVFLFFEQCFRDPDCLGMLYFTQRRAGKTSIAAFLNFIITSSIRNSHGGIQSKDDPGGKMVFQKHIVNGVKRLPWWLRPIQSGSEDPKGNELSFHEPGEMITKKKLKEGMIPHSSDNALNSRITYGPSTETFYDGEQLVFYHGDEIGKVDRIDAVERHRIVAPCLMVGKNIVGKMLYTTTVEDIGKNALKNAKKLWDDSDPHEKDANGRTASKLYRYFKPAYDGFEGFIDEFGNSQEDEARQYILAERQAYKDKGDLKGWAEIVRKFPIDASEPFTPNAQDCFFDVGKLAARKNELQTMEIMKNSPVVRGDLVWIDNVQGGWQSIDDFNNSDRIVRSGVRFIPSPNGRFLRAFPPTNPNNVGVDIDGKLIPRNAGVYSGGIDPFDFSSTENDRGSKGSGAIFIHANPIEPEETDRWAMIYVHRPDLNTEFYEDMVKMLHYYGCKAVVERNKAMCRNYIANRGFAQFIYGKLRLDPTIPMKKSDSVSGEYTSRTQLTSITEAFTTYVYESYDKIDFIELIDQLFGWSIKDSNKYDLVIAAGFSLLAARFAKHKTRSEPTQREAEALQQFFATYDYQGNSSVRRTS